ncbi:hypothetical protein Cgig2_001252 [Carnegiea gigantea]|uniref:Uncharacterized protein n=1 Tax=Carnegiea gigantea TaxID=171969 RepID=A0A9Q1JRL1_9CARY|nr:hypothetical protein Cgig2_001252 [Carnegiea gigantea]
MGGQSSHQHRVLEDPLLQLNNDIKGEDLMVSISKVCSLTPSPFSTSNECCECLAYYGIAKNLVNYISGKLHERNVSAARTSGMSRFGLPCGDSSTMCNFFWGLYLIALGTGGIKPCVSSFGADKFDDTDTNERVKKGSFFNWFYFSISIGSFVSISLIIWIQETIGWGIGFGIPATSMGFAIAFFFSVTSLHRFQRPGGSPLTRVCQVVVASWHKRNLDVSPGCGLVYETSNLNSAIERSHKLDHTDGIMWLDKAAVLMDDGRKTGDFSNPWRLCSVTQVEELKILVRMFLIWVAGIVFSAVYS